MASFFLPIEEIVKNYNRIRGYEVRLYVDRSAFSIIRVAL